MLPQVRLRFYADDPGPEDDYGWSLFKELKLRWNCIDSRACSFDSSGRMSYTGETFEVISQFWLKDNCLEIPGKISPVYCFD